MGNQSIINIKNKTMKLKYICVVAMLVGLTACEQGKYDNEVEVPVEVVSGDADFTNMVSFGASFVAGVSDATVFIASQENSFPNIMAQQMALAGGGEFIQPMVNDNIGGLLYGGNVIVGPRLYFDGSGPATLDGTPTTETTNVITGPFNNMGVPSAKSFHFLAEGYGNLAGVPLGLANPYFARMASSPSATILEDALAKNASFLVISDVGGNDVLSYAISGGTGVDQTGNFDPTTYGPDDITDPNVFAQATSGIVGALTAGGAKGVIANIPYVTDLPYFTTVPFNPLDPNDPDSNFGALVPALNELYGRLNAAYAFLGVSERSVVFSETEVSPVVIEDKSLANIGPQLIQVLIGGGVDPLTATLLGTQFGQSRQANEGDLLTLPNLNYIGNLNEEYFAFLVSRGVPPADAGQLSVNGITYPLGDQWVLIPDEINSIKTATDAYNATITALAAQTGLGLVDAKSILEQLNNGGIASDGFLLRSDYVFGGTFSMDGLHFSARGSAMLANEFLKVIDESFNSNFQEANALVDVGNYPAFYSENLP